MSAIVAVYAGDTIAGARLVTATADRRVVAEVARLLLAEPEPTEPIVLAVERGKRRALRLIVRAEGDGRDGETAVRP